MSDLNIKKIDWKGFCISIVVSVLLSFIYCYFLGELNWQNWADVVNIFLSMTALPALFISFAVFNNLNDVKKQIEKENKLKNFYDRREQQELNNFLNNYSNFYKTNSQSLQKDIENILLDKTGFSQNFHDRVKQNCYSCKQSIDSYRYVKSWVSINGRDLEITGEENVYSFDIQSINNLPNLLNNGYSNREQIKDKDFCQNLQKGLTEFEKLCDYLIIEAGKGESSLSKEDQGESQQQNLAGGEFFD